jgi:hypothetical protein
MARRKPNPKAESILFNVIYEDGSLSSNRKVPSEVVGSFDGDKPAKPYLEQQDREISEKSGRPRPAIKTVERVK